MGANGRPINTNQVMAATTEKKVALMETRLFILFSMGSQQSQADSPLRWLSLECVISFTHYINTYIILGVEEDWSHVKCLVYL